MTAPRVLVVELRAGAVTLSGEPYHYLARVLRLRAGDEVEAFDGAGRAAPARIARLDPGRERLELDVGPLSPFAAAEGARLPIWLLASLLKGERMDLVVQKATELGVERIVPVAAARSVVRLDPDRAQGRVARWRKIAQEAARQSGRADAPDVAPVAAFAEAVALAPAAAWRILLWEGALGAPLAAVMPALPPAGVVLAIGPEGGLTEAEVELARGAGFAVAGLGPRVLRAETAALAALAILGYALGDLGCGPGAPPRGAGPAAGR